MLYTRFRLSRATVLVGLLLGACRSGAGTGSSTTLLVFNAGSLAGPMRALLDSFVVEHDGVVGVQEHSGSLEAARKISDLEKIPDLLAVADAAVIPALLMPDYATWQVTFARNALVLLRSASAPPGSGPWTEILLQPGLRIGRADPDRDPNGYRAVMAMQLAGKASPISGLTDQLLAASPPRYMREKGADLLALIQTGDLDYAWSYRSHALMTGTDYLPLPDSIALDDPTLNPWYQRARVSVPGAQGERVEIRGAAIVYALTIPDHAAHPDLAADFVRFVLSPKGQHILTTFGFLAMDHPVASGTPPASLFPDWNRVTSDSFSPSTAGR